MKKRKEKPITLTLSVPPIRIERWLIIALLCGNIIDDSALLTEKPRLGQISYAALQCDAMSSLKDT